MELNTTLLRERFVITDPETPNEPELIALSNRMTISMKAPSGSSAETLTLRTQNMHGCIRLAAQLLHGFLRTGPLLNRPVPFNYAGVWDSIVPDHDVRFVPQRWACVYARGKPVFSSGEHHGFLDVIEKCDAVNPGNYDKAVQIAEETFRKMGRDLHIRHESNIGMVVHVRPGMARCGLILRNPHKATTFNFNAEGAGDFCSTSTHCLNACAAFLEGVQLAVRVGMLQEKARRNLIERTSAEFGEMRSGESRLGILANILEGFEKSLTVRYRPERPDLGRMRREGTLFQRSLLGS